ncbi:MAG: F0F1 ATP synthase subunit epsilon [Flavobacteriaceae bacterium]
MYLEIISPETTLFRGEITAISLPGTKGSFQILENHAPIVSTLQKGRVTVKGTIELPKEAHPWFESVSPNELILSIASGTVEMKDNKIILLSD